MAETTTAQGSADKPTKAAKEPTIFVIATQRDFGFRVGPDTPGTKDGKLMFKRGEVVEVPAKHQDAIATYYGAWLACYGTKADAEKALGVLKEKAKQEAAK